MRRSSAPCFLVDEMLMRLGRWLRAAGYDAQMLAPGTNDAAWVATADREGELLITRDRKMELYRDACGFVICLHANDTEGCVRELAERIAIDWLYAPFSRCLACNARLVAGDADAWRKVPAFSRRLIDRVWRCAGCGQIYWHGSHVRRMHHQLVRWQRLNSSQHIP